MQIPGVTARSVQVSLDEELLQAIDRRRETKRDGRSAVVRRALRLYLELSRRREIDAAYGRAYGGAQADAVFEELADLMRGQAWPEE